MIAAFYLRLAGAAAIASALAGAVWLHNGWIKDGRQESLKQGRAEVQAKWTAEQLDVARQSLKLSEQATRDSATLQANADKTTGVKNAQIARLNTDLHGALERLRHERPARDGAAGVPSHPAPGANPGCTAAQLYREDASALVREADRADRLLADLAHCQAAYGAARDALSGVGQ